MTETLMEEKEEEIKLSPEPKISFILPVYKVPTDQFKRTLMCLEDQDYPNMEIIIVFDGYDPDLLKIATPYLTDSRFKIIETDHGGACKARNIGFEASTGEIISFFNSDYNAKKGMVRMWVDELLAHPDCGFIYGGYEWMSAQRSMYPSKNFDAFELTQENYIDCGFPLWRKYVVPWDENCKSLQDWDFWIRVVKKHDVKGHYLGREISYAAALPREKGLSDDSANNWIDRVTYVREKNGIPTNDIVVTSLGASYHGREIAKMIGADYREHTIFKPNNYKALYLIGFYVKPDSPIASHARIIAHYKGKKRIVHFVGADIYWLYKFSKENLNELTGAMNLECDHILAENEIARKELIELGFNSKLISIVPIPPYQDYEVKQLPDEFKCSIFLTDKSDFDKYCQEETLSIVRAMPDIKFTAYGDAGKNISYPNLQICGNLNKEEWKKYVYSNSCYLRLVRHDTRPMASDEFMLAGRNVVSNIPAVHMDYIDTSGIPQFNEWRFYESGLNDRRWPETKSKIVQKIREIKNRSWDEKKAQLIHDYYENILNRENYIKTIKEMCL